MNRHTDIEYPTPTNQPTVELGSAPAMVAVKSALRLYGSKVTLGKWLGGQDPEEPVDRKVVGRSCIFEVTWSYEMVTKKHGHQSAYNLLLYANLNCLS